MADGATIMAMLAALTTKVDGLAADVAVLKDRRSDGDAQDATIAALAVRVGKLEVDLVARNARWKVLAGLIAGGSAVTGAGAAKLLALIGG